MKRILFICTLLVSLFAMSGCSDDINTPVLTTDEYPRILGRWPDKQEDGTLGKFSIPLNQVLNINVQYTPAELCEGTMVSGRKRNPQRRRMDIRTFDHRYFSSRTDCQDTDQGNQP